MPHIEGLFETQSHSLRVEVVRSHNKMLNRTNLSTAESIVNILQKHFETVTLTHIDTAADLEALVERAPDLVLLGMYYVINPETGAKVWLSDTLEKNAIHHTGSNKAAHRLAINKYLAKQRVIESGLRTAPFSIVRKEDEKTMNFDDVVYPLFVKPANKGGGLGIDEFSVVHDVISLQRKLAAIHDNIDTEALVETYLNGREFSVAVIQDRDTGALTAFPVELIATADMHGDRLLSKAVKSSNEEQVLPVTDPVAHAQLSHFAKQIFNALGAQDYGRIDIRCDSDDVPYFLEANLLPSITEGYGSFPKAYELYTGESYETMLLHILELALNREPKNAALI